MEIVQIDSKTIRLETGDFTFFLKYSFSWDKSLRAPESIVLEGSSIKAFFLTSVINDRITEDEKGFYISRSWNIVPVGDISLFFNIELKAQKNVPFFFPCILNEDRASQNQLTISGERLSLPSGVFLYPEGKSIFFGLELPETSADQGSIGLSRSNCDGIPSIKIEMAFPPRELLPKQLLSIPGLVCGPAEPAYASEGNLKKQTVLNVLIAPEKEIMPLAFSFYLKKWRDGASPGIQITRGAASKLVKDGIDTCLNSLLVESEGIFGPLVSEKSDSISGIVCAGLSYLIQKVYENNYDMNEISLKLADFCLKSQHPSGVFFNYYSVRSKEWGMDEKKPRALKRDPKSEEHLIVPMDHSAAVSDYLISVALIQSSKGLSGEKYFNAARRFIELFFDIKKKGLYDLGSFFILDTMEPKEKSKLCLDLIFPMLKLYKITGEDKYRKAIAAIKAEFFIENFAYTALPACTDGNAPDFSTSLILLKTAIALEELGIRLKDKEIFVNMALPWIYLNKSQASLSADFEPFSGGIIDSFERCRIIFRNFELAYYLLGITGMVDKKPLAKLARSLASHLVDSAGRNRLGIPWFHHSLYNNEQKERNAKPVTGVFDSRSFVREAGYLLKILDDFPDVIK